MELVTRRTLLRLVPIWAGPLGLGLGFGRGSAQDSIEKVQRIVVGPLALSELYDNMEDKESGQILLRGTGLDSKVIVQAFDHSYIYIIDQQVIKTDNQRFAPYSSGYPKILVGGRMAFVFKGTGFAVHLAGIECRGEQTSVSPPFRSFRLLVQMTTSGYRAELVRGVIVNGYDWSFSVPRLKYDFDGQLQFPSGWVKR